MIKGMKPMTIRLAEHKDIDQLIKMRWDFTLEHNPSVDVSEESYEAFAKECKAFLEDAINSGTWFIWVAEKNGNILSHIYIELIQKVPRPGRVTHPFAYMTNVYTLESYRSKGTGSRLLATINEWIKNKKYEFVIVWPSEDSVNFYNRNGYKHCTEPMEFFPE